MYGAAFFYFKCFHFQPKVIISHVIVDMSLTMYFCLDTFDTVC